MVNLRRLSTEKEIWILLKKICSLQMDLVGYVSVCVLHALFRQYASVIPADCGEVISIPCLLKPRKLYSASRQVPFDKYLTHFLWEH